MRYVICLTAYIGFALIGVAQQGYAAPQAIQLAASPGLSTDGTQLAISWAGDIWVVAATGGEARRLTATTARERDPLFSRDGTRIAFVSDRSGSDQVYVVDQRGGKPTQLTFHTEGFSLEDWDSGDRLLITAERDHFWKNAERFFWINSNSRSQEELVFDAQCHDGRLSPDGTQLVFSREGERWWRKGYRGSRASQIWTYDLKQRKFSEIVKRDTESRSPLWRADGQGIYYVSGASGSLNLWERELSSGDERQLTHFTDDSVLWPCISRDGSLIVFRQGFDLYALSSDVDSAARKLEITADYDEARDAAERNVIEQATEVSFTSDGLEMAFIAGGDLWVMDTELREPRQVTATEEEESMPAFSPDGNTIAFVSERDDQCDIWQATRADVEKFWWLNETFQVTRLTNDGEVESNVQWSPRGDRIGYVRGQGDLWVVDYDSQDSHPLLRSWNEPDYDWSPDGKWIVCAFDDADFNRDIHILPIDGSQELFNLSRHPDDDFAPQWSPNGKTIAFTGRRMADETDIYFVFLEATEDEATPRERKLTRAIEKIEKARKARAKGKPIDDSAEDDSSETAESDDVDKSTTVPDVTIDFAGIHERLRQVTLPGVTESQLFWSYDSKRLAFRAEIDGKLGTYTISPPDELKPKLLTSETGVNAVWLETEKQVVWLSTGTPASVTEDKTTKYPFSVYQQVDRSARYAAAFDKCWRLMRDHFYDDALNNRNWDAIRRKYKPVAIGSTDSAMFGEVVNLMLGELNGSHLGFTPSSEKEDTSGVWLENTAHLGVRFDPTHNGPGLMIRDVLKDGPADRVESRLEPGDRIINVDGVPVDPAMDLTSVLNGRLPRDVRLVVRNRADTDREVVVRPIEYSAARSRLYENWIDQNRQRVAELSGGTLGYLHIRGMNFPSFYRFEQELYAVGHGKDGIVIDVRENGGGSTTDHLLTVLTQPAHAITVPRGGTSGYPQDRSVYATWRKPIVVLCNQNSFSNAEIFSHAIKSLKRGKLVGVPTAGGVISTGRSRIMDVGSLRIPFRGWYVLGTGEDMELNGAVPHHILWPAPSDMPAGRDAQLVKAVQVLKRDVKRSKRTPLPDLRKASQRQR